MADKARLSEAEQALFRRAMAGVSQLRDPSSSDSQGPAGRSENGRQAADAGSNGPVSVASGRPKGLSAGERELFAQAMAGVERLRSDARPPIRQRPSPRPLDHDLRQAGGGYAPVADDGPADGAGSVAEVLWFARGGLQESLLRKLRRGRLAVGGELDLHGMNASEALRAVGQFIAEARRRDIRCVRIIHGKGRWSVDNRPVLKGRVDRWLRQRHDVLAFCSAPAALGGTGAVHVLLRRPAVAD